MVFNRPVDKRTNIENLFVKKCFFVHNDTLWTIEVYKLQEYKNDSISILIKKKKKRIKLIVCVLRVKRKPYCSNELVNL